MYRFMLLFSLPVFLLTNGIAYGEAGSPSQETSQGIIRLDQKSLNGKKHYINPELVGFNLLYWIDDKACFESGALVDQIQKIHPGLLRYPAGTASQNYDWRSNKVINSRLFPFNPQNELLDTDSYISVIKSTGAGAVVVLDIASVHLKDRLKAVNKGQDGYVVAQPVPEAEEQAMVDKAVAWAEHFKAKGVSPVCYELGNEHYLAFLDYMAFTPEMYAAKCKRFIQAIRKVDPGARFAIGGPESLDGSHSYYKDTPWWPVVLKELAPDVDRIVLHHYWKPKHLKEVAEIRDLCDPYGAFRDDLAKWGKQNRISTGHLKIGFTEWGGRGYMDQQTFGLFCFNMLAGLAENGVDYAIEWPFRWPDAEKDEFGEVQLIEQKTGVPRFAFHVLSAWSRFFSGKQQVGFEARLPKHVCGFAAVDEAGRPVLALANGTDEIQAVRLDVDWPEKLQTWELFEVSADGLRKTGEERSESLRQVSVQLGTILILVAQ